MVRPNAQGNQNNGADAEAVGGPEKRAPERGKKRSRTELNLRSGRVVRGITIMLQGNLTSKGLGLGFVRSVSRDKAAKRRQ